MHRKNSQDTCTNLQPGEYIYNGDKGATILYTSVCVSLFFHFTGKITKIKQITKTGKNIISCDKLSKQKHKHKEIFVWLLWNERERGGGYSRDQESNSNGKGLDLFNVII